MALINERKRFWRAASLALLILALLGPWGYDRINVPAEYTCNPPSFRLEGDFCGTPLSGAWIVFWFPLGFVADLVSLSAGKVSFVVKVQQFLITLLLIFPWLPLLSTPLAIWRKDSRRLNMFQLKAWALATILGLFLVVSTPQRLLWGAWAYAGLTPVVVIMELLAFSAERKAGKDHKN
jgi:hypothetical protein